VKYNLRLTYSAMPIMIAYSAAMAILPVVLSSLISEFSLNGGEKGLMSSFISLGAFTALAGSTYLQGRVRKPLVITLSCITGSIILLVMGISRNFTLILPCFFLLGFFMSGLLDAFINSYVVDLNPGNSGPHVSVLHAWYGAGGLIAPVIFQQTAMRGGRQAVFLLAAAFLFLLMLPFTITGMKAGREPAPAAKMDSKLNLKAIGEFFSGKRNLLLLACMFFYSATQNTHVLWIILYMITLHNNPGYGAIALSGFWVCCTLCRFFAPRLPGRPILKFTLGMFPSAVFLAIGLISGSPFVMIAASCLFGLLGGHSIPTLINECARHYQGATTFPSSIMLLSVHTAGMVMPVFMGVMAGHFSLQNAIIILPVMALVASFFGLMYLLRA